MATVDINSVQQLCDNYIKTKNFNHFQLIDFSTRPTSSTPNGFLGCHQYLKISCSYKNQLGEDKVETLNFFVKSAPCYAEALVEYLNEFGVFEKEEMVFKKLLPYMKCVPIQVAPVCYVAEKNFLIFEDLNQMGYKLGAKRDGILDYKHLVLAVKSLAALHAGSIVLEKKVGKRIDQLQPDAVRENAYPKGTTEDHVRRQNVLNGIEVFLQMLKTMPQYEKNLDAINAEFREQMLRIFDLAQTSNEFVNVLSHGDLWANNIMFKYDTVSNVTISCQFVDFQLARYAPPMMDLITMLTIPTSAKFRQIHLTELCQKYYQYLTEYLQQNNIEIDNLLPKTEFNRTLEYYRIAGIIESLLFSHLTILPTDLTQNITGTSDGFTNYFSKKRVQICMEAFRRDEIYKNRLLDMLQDFVDNFVLPKLIN